MSKNKKKSKDELSFLECVKVIFITLIGILAPSLLIGYIIKLITSLNLLIGTGVGVVIVLIVGYLLGFHKPATANEYNENDEEDDD